MDKDKNTYSTEELREMGWGFSYEDLAEMILGTEKIMGKNELGTITVEEKVIDNG